MAIWAELKKVVNSNFSKPLNELITDESQEILEIVDKLGKAYTPSNTLVKTVLSSEKSTTNSNNSTFFYLGKWIPEYSGAVKVTFSKKSSSSSVQSTCLVGTLSMVGDNVSSVLNEAIKLDNATAGTLVTSVSNYWIKSFGGSASTSYTTASAIIEVEKGVPVYFGLQSGSSSETAYCNKITINASEV